MSEMKTPLYFTFGNHMHWVDMQWLWGYGVLPGSVRDMLHLIKETGARGNVNFDGIGYEKMAAECPEALAELREAVGRGEVEPVGCSYGQPYGLFHGGESNIRQLTYGVRSVRRLLGVRARSFWEEEFYFFPQLPQLLRGCGFTGASLFFQWTWHTPEVPREEASLIMWEGIDGTRIPTLPRNELNLHQWPEDFEGLLGGRDGATEGGGDEGGGKKGWREWGLTPAVVQWLELMPSKDWMCRSEVLLPRLKELMGDARFEVRVGTVGEVIAGLLEECGGGAGRSPTPCPLPEGGGGRVPVRAYTMDDVWHGMTLGKNGDEHPRASREVEELIRAAESASAVASLFGRPYASWDVYPTWELEEAWRELLAAQHHDNHECEGLCGFVGYQQFEKARMMAMEVLGRASWLIGARAGVRASWSELEEPLMNPLGVEWPVLLPWDVEGEALEVRVPALGYCVVRDEPATEEERAEAWEEPGRMVLQRGEMRCEVERKTGAVTLIGKKGTTWKGSFFSLGFHRAGQPVVLVRAKVERLEDDWGPVVEVSYEVSKGKRLTFLVALARDVDGVDISVVPEEGEEDMTDLDQDPGFGGALQATIKLNGNGKALVVRADTPLAVERVEGSSRASRKYPRGDWMTSPQWFEAVERPFTASTFVNITEQGGPRGMLILHNGSQQWMKDREGVRVVLSAVDPWDEGRSHPGTRAMSFRMIPHAGVTDAQCVRYAELFRVREGPLAGDPLAVPVGGGTADELEEDMPRAFGPLEVCGAPGVLVQAFYRESMKSGEHLPAWAGHRMFEASGGACDHPFVIRLVEWDGKPARVRLKLAGRVAMAAKTNLLGEVDGGEGIEASGHLGIEAGTGWLTVKHPVEAPWWGRLDGEVARFRGKAITWSEVEFEVRAREVVTVYADMEMGRKEFRDLDAKRKVWAGVHRVGEGMK